MTKYNFIDKALYFPVEKILCLGDVHIGYEEALNKRGILIPRHQFEETMQDLKNIFEQTGKVDEIVILGDLKHEFGKISEQEWNETFRFLEFLQERCRKIVVVKGNHDIILEPILRKFPAVRFVEVYYYEDMAFIHGNKEIKLGKKIKIIVKGHLHPAITISSGVKKETYKCFLVGKEKNREIIILPSFLPIIEGSDVSGEEEFRNYTCFVVGGKVYEFGKVKNI